MLDVKTVDAATIDAALNRPWWRFRLSAELEARFEAETGAERCRHLIIFGMVALAVYDLFVFADRHLTPDIVSAAMMMRLGVVTPLSLAIVIVLRMNPSPAIRESLEAAITVVVTSSILWLMLQSHDPLRVYHHGGIVLVVLFANVVQRIRFWYALAASLISLALYAAALSSVPEIPPDGGNALVLMLASAIAFTLMASHSLEREARRDFLLSWRDRLNRDELQRLSHRDPLTGLGNRRRLDNAMARLLPVARARREYVAVLMIDVDEFKAFNDCYGHLAGDNCLKRVSAILTAEFRGSEDIIVRFGGEELTVILREVDLHSAQQIAERIRRAVEEMAIPHEASQHGVVTISVGVASGVPSAEFGQNDLLAAADAALYGAKRNGRNRVWPPLRASLLEIVPIADRPAPKVRTG